MIAIIEISKATQNPPSPTINASVSTSGAPKVVSRLFFGAPASVRPICRSIIMNFLSSTGLGACADRLAKFHVCRFSERSDRPLDRIEYAGAHATSNLSARHWHGNQPLGEGRTDQASLRSGQKDAVSHRLTHRRSDD